MFYERVEKLCNEAGISVTRLADEIGLSSGVPTGWKTGAVPRKSTVKKIADFFHVSVEFLLGEDVPGTIKMPIIQQDDGLADRIAKFIALPPELQQKALDIFQWYVENQEHKQ